MDHTCILPTSPLSLCEDRFSILPVDSGGQPVLAWSLIVAVLESPTRTVEHLIGHLETFAICLHGRSDNNFGHLRNFMKQHWDSTDFIDRVYPVLVALALDLRNLFPEGVIPVLSSSSPSCTLTRRQVASLIIHQFFCTILPPSWLLPDCSADFHIWYTPSQQHPHATHAYLWALFTFFDRLASEAWITRLSASEWPITLTLHSSSRSQIPMFEAEVHFSPLTIRAITAASTHPSLLGLPSGACVISANKYIGFGRTGTQEETHVGCSPEAFPALLFVPPLQDNQVVVLEGAEAFITMEGHGREATLGSVLAADYNRENHLNSKWRRRTMLFMDALELDLCDPNDGVADLLPGHLDRELTKAYIAFSSREAEPYREVVTGMWGCRSFGGNAEIKAILQWCAASIAQDFSHAATQQGWTIPGVLSKLRLLRPDDETGLHAFVYISESLSSMSRPFGQE